MRHLRRSPAPIKEVVMDPELVAMIRSICRGEVQGELKALRADVNKLKRLLREVKEEEFFGHHRECGVPWECLDRRQASKGYTQLAAEREWTGNSAATCFDYPVAGGVDNATVTITDQDVDVEAANQDYRGIVDRASNEFELYLDVWGAATFVIVKDLPTLMNGGLKLEVILRIITIVFSLALNIFLQFMFLYWVADLVMLPNIKELQDTYRTYHLVAFDESGSFDAKGFESLGKDGHASICTMALSSSLFMSACLFLWVARCFNEIRSVYRRKHSLDILPQLPSGVSADHMVYELLVEKDDFVTESKDMIVCLNTSTRLMLSVFVVGPRMLVAIFLLLIGTAFLTSSHSFDDLILNSLAMGFVFGIDELIFTVFLPLRLAKNIESTKIVTPPDEDVLQMQGQELDEAVSRSAYMKAILYFCGVLSFMTIWQMVEPVLPGFEHDIAPHCSGYYDVITDVTCKLWERDCFPKARQLPS